MSRPPAAFFSYTHHDDTHDDGRLTELREKLQGELRTVTGERFEIFQDHEAIEWGKHWKKRIEEGLITSTFLIPVITPGYLKSAGCRAELQEFLKHEKKAGRDDLVLPLIYVETPALTDEKRRREDPLAENLAARQYKDWRDLRFEPWTNPAKFRRLHLLACQIRDALEKRVNASRKASVSWNRTKNRASAMSDAAATSASPGKISEPIDTRSAPLPRSEPKTYVVDPMPGRGDFRSITSAVAAAEAGARIVVRAGYYAESVVLDKPLEIVGEGQRDKIYWTSKGKSVLVFTTEFGRVVNFTLRQEGGGSFPAIEIGQGRPTIEECDISSAESAAIRIYNGAEPVIMRCTIHHSAESGIAYYKNAGGLAEDNEIFANGLANIATASGANPIVRRNRIHDGKQGGIMCYETGGGTIEDNEIFQNSYAGIEVREQGTVVIRRNRIRDGKTSGVFIHTQTKSIAIEDNQIFANGLDGIAIRSNAEVVVRHNRINDNASFAIRIGDGCRGTFESNDLRKNGRGGWNIADDSVKLVTRSDNKEDPPAPQPVAS